MWRSNQVDCEVGGSASAYVGCLVAMLAALVVATADLAWSATSSPSESESESVHAVPSVDCDQLYPTGKSTTIDRTREMCRLNELIASGIVEMAETRRSIDEGIDGVQGSGLDTILGTLESLLRSIRSAVDRLAGAGWLPTLGVVGSFLAVLVAWRQLRQAARNADRSREIDERRYENDRVVEQEAKEAERQKREATRIEILSELEAGLRILRAEVRAMSRVEAAPSDGFSMPAVIPSKIFRRSRLGDLGDWHAATAAIQIHESFDRLRTMPTDADGRVAFTSHEALQLFLLDYLDLADQTVLLRLCLDEAQPVVAAAQRDIESDFDPKFLAFAWAAGSPSAHDVPGPGTKTRLRVRTLFSRFRRSDGDEAPQRTLNDRLCDELEAARADVDRTLEAEVLELTRRAREVVGDWWRSSGDESPVETVDKATTPSRPVVSSGVVGTSTV